MAQQAKNFIQDVDAEGLQLNHLIHDWDAEFTKQFDAILKSERTEIHEVGPAKPNLNAYAERFVQTIQDGCLDPFIVLGRKHLDPLAHEFADVCTTKRGMICSFNKASERQGLPCNIVFEQRGSGCAFPWVLNQAEVEDFGEDPVLIFGNRFDEKDQIHGRADRVCSTPGSALFRAARINKKLCIRLPVEGSGITSVPVSQSR